MSREKKKKKKTKYLQTNDNANALSSTRFSTRSIKIYIPIVGIILKLTPAMVQDHPKMETWSKFSTDERAASEWRDFGTRPRTYNIT